MGISTHIYAIWGRKIPWNDAFSEAYDEVYDDDDTPDVIMDGMGGDYMILGTKLFDSGDFRWGLDNGDAYKEVDIASFPQIELAYKSAWRAKFPALADLVDKPFGLIVLTHYS